jgi:Helicase associated domain
MIIYMCIPHFVEMDRVLTESPDTSIFSGKQLVELLNAMKNHKPAQRDPTKPINLRRLDALFKLYGAGGLARTDPRIARILFWRSLVTKRWKLSQSKRNMGPSLVLSSTSTMAEWNRGNRPAPYNNLSSSTEEEEEDRYPRNEAIQWPTGEENPNAPHRPSHQGDTFGLFASSSFHAPSDPSYRHTVSFPLSTAVYDASSGSPVVSTYMGPEYAMSPLHSSAARPSEDHLTGRNVAGTASQDHGNRDDDDRKPSPVRSPRGDTPRNFSQLAADDVQLSPPHGRHSLSTNPFRSRTSSPSNRRVEIPPTQDQFINPMFSFEDYDTGLYDLQQTLLADFTPVPTFDQAPIAFRLGSDHRRLASRAMLLGDHAPASVAESIHSLPAQNPQHELRRRVASPSELEAAETERARSAVITWYERFNELIDYCEIYNDCNVPQKYPANPKLGIVRLSFAFYWLFFFGSNSFLSLDHRQWVNKQRMEKKFMDEEKRTSMTARKVEALESIGFTWAKRKGDASWMCKYNELQAFAEQFGTCDVPTKYAPNPALGRWVSTQRSEYKIFMQSGGRSRHLTQGKIDMLNSLGFKWEMIPTRLSNSSNDGSSNSTTNRGGRRGYD